MTGRPTIKDVAARAGVGVVTVSRALNDKPGVSAETRERIKQVADALGYRANRHARFLKLSHNRNIALMMKGIDNPFFQQMLDTMETEARSRDYMLTVVQVPHWADELEEATKLVDEDAVAGIIFLGGNFSHDIRVLENLRVPFVLSTMSGLRGVPEDAYASVAVDDFMEAKKAVGKLVNLGHRNIALIGMDFADASVGRLRSEGYRAALEEAGIPVRSEYTPHTDLGGASPYTYRYGYEMARELIAANPDVTAIFAIADVMAIGVLKAVLEAGRRVPEDVSIVGFDGIPVASYVTPALTTVVQPAKQIAELTCRALFDRIEGGAARHVRVSATLQEGCTMAPPRA